MAYYCDLRAPWPQLLPNGRDRKPPQCQSSSCRRRARRESRRLTRRLPGGSTRRANPRRPSPTPQRRVGLCEDHCFRVVLLALVLHSTAPQLLFRQVNGGRQKNEIAYISVFHFSVSHSYCAIKIRRSRTLLPLGPVFPSCLVSIGSPFYASQSLFRQVNGG